MEDVPIKNRTLTIGKRGAPKAIWLGIICVMLFVTESLVAHSDLNLQIENLTRQISAQPGDTELLLRRGDLYRRHADWQAGKRDFEAVRKLQPDHPRIDWFEGRLLVAAGKYAQGEALLTRFLVNTPNHSGAYRTRAVAREHLRQPIAAAEDYRAAINTSKSPSPSLYRSLVMSHVAAGIDHTGDAISATDEGLALFPQEFSLVGLGTDLSLSRADVQLAMQYMTAVPPGLEKLPQWKYRLALRSCIDGDPDVAAGLLTKLLSTMPKDSAQRSGTWRLPVNTVTGLAANPDAEACKKAAWEMLQIK